MQKDPELMMLIKEGKHGDVIRKCMMGRKTVVDSKFTLYSSWSLPHSVLLRIVNSCTTIKWKI